MKSLVICLLAIASLLAFSSCEDEFGGNDGTQIEKEFTLSGFSKIDLGDALVVDITAGGTFSVVANGRDRDVNDLELSVVNGKLQGGFRDFLRSRKRTTITITLPQLTDLRLHGAAEGELTGFTAADMDIELSGAADLDADGEWTRLDLELSGASDLTLDGTVGTMNATLHGASDLFAQQSHIEYCVVNLSGSSNARVTVSESLSGELSGASELNYWGDPATVNVDVSSGSKLVRK